MCFKDLLIITIKERDSQRQRNVSKVQRRNSYPNVITHTPKTPKTPLQDTLGSVTYGKVWNPQSETHLGLIFSWVKEHDATVDELPSLDLQQY